MMISVTLHGDKAVAARLAAIPTLLHDVLIRKVTALSLMLQGYIQQSKLSGQVLNVRTGALRRSIHSFVEDRDPIIVGGALSSGDVKYARPHEFGFSGEVTVKEHLRTVVFGRTVDPFSVGPYTMRMSVPERSFMRTGLADKAQYISSELKQAVVSAMVGGS